MRIVAAQPFRTGSVAWQEERDQWTLTVVCKATYVLQPGVAPVAAEPEDIVETDNHWDDDPQKSLYAASDLAPVKPSPEVIVVGSAFAPRGEKVTSLIARVVVGEVDKTAKVFLVARDIDAAGVVREGIRSSQMPLRYERAARGADGRNPVGVSDALDPEGRRALPNLVLPGAHDGGGDPRTPVGFGPLAWSWPERRSRLVGRRSWSEKRWPAEPLGESFDMSFFQAAPTDQRVKELHPDEAIVLENLHPKHRRLETRLPGVFPVARVAPRDAAPWDVTLVADTLWIDTNRGLCTLTWRGQVPLSARDQAGEIVIAAEGYSPPAEPPSSGPAIDDPELSNTMADEDEIGAAFGAPKPVLPFAGNLSPLADPADAPRPPRPAVPVLFSDEDVQDGGLTDARPIAPRRGAAPAWLPVAATGPAPPTLNVVSGAPAATQRPPLMPAPLAAVATPAPIPQHSASPLSLSLYGVSNAAAGDTAARPSRSLAPELASTPPPAVSAGASRALVELVWHDPTKIDAVRRVPAWELLFEKAKPSASPPPPSPSAGGGADAAASAAAAEDGKRERADLQAVLGRGASITSAESALLDAIAEDGSFTAPLVLLAGELELGLDEVKMLEAMLGAAAAFAPGDKKLKEVIELAAEITKTPLGASPAVAGGFVARLREAWTRSLRLLPPDYLDVNTRRLLLEQRSYQTRGLWGDSFLRGVLIPPSSSGSNSVPTYLPAAVANRLPLIARFPVRLVAEVLPQQDPLESSPVALRAVALGRVVQARASR